MTAVEQEGQERPRGPSDPEAVAAWVADTVYAGYVEYLSLIHISEPTRPY